MNKYQEACKDILHYLTVIYEDYGIDYRDEFEILEEAVDKSSKYDELQKVYFNNEPTESADLNGVKLQELYDFNSKLLDKETPKKPISKRLYYNCHNGECDKTFIHYCPVCNFSSVEKDYANFCPNCGQKLSWSDEDE